MEEVLVQSYGETIASLMELGNKFEIAENSVLDNHILYDPEQ
jgi:hypothetical protein